MRIVSFSGGKDSTAMVHLLLEKNEQIDHIMYFESGWDFPEMDEHIKHVEKNIGIKIIRIRYYRYFNELLSRYGWPHPSGGWCVDCKTGTCNKLFRGLKGTVEYIGYTTNEVFRSKRKGIKNKKWLVRFPLIEHGFSEVDTLSYCKALGYEWGGLYNIFNRLSCFCCPKAGRTQINKLKSYFPKLYKQYLTMDKIANADRDTI